jgi:hypothetical protein
MAKILRLKDRLKVKIGDVVFTIAPLSYLQKQELANCTSIKGGQERLDLARSQALYLKYSVKDIEGVESYNGEKYELEFEGDHLTDECVSDLFHLEEREKLSIASWQLLNGIKELRDPVTGEELEGVSIEVESGK